MRNRYPGACYPCEIDEQGVRDVRLVVYPSDDLREVEATGADGFVAVRTIDRSELLDMMGRSDVDALIARRKHEAIFDAAHRCITLEPGAYRVVNKEDAYV